MRINIIQDRFNTEEMMLIMVGRQETANNNYNKGFAAQKALLGTSDTVNCEIPNI